MVVEFDCGECGTKLEEVTSTAGDSDPYPTVWLTCPNCGAAWEQDADGVLTKRRKSL